MRTWKEAAKKYRSNDFGKTLNDAAILRNTLQEQGQDYSDVQDTINEAYGLRQGKDGKFYSIERPEVKDDDPFQRPSRTRMQGNRPDRFMPTQRPETTEPPAMDMQNQMVNQPNLELNVSNSNKMKNEILKPSRLNTGELSRPGRFDSFIDDITTSIKGFTSDAFNKATEVVGKLRDISEKAAPEIKEINKQDKVNTIVTTDSLKQQSSNKGPYRMVIDPNTNTAMLYKGNSLFKQYEIGTGDTTGTRYGKKFFTWTGPGEVIRERELSSVPGNMGPFGLTLSHPNPTTGKQNQVLHGQYDPASEIFNESGDFVNDGYVSHACVRFKNKDIEEVAKYMDVGCKVDITEYK